MKQRNRGGRKFLREKKKDSFIPLRGRGRVSCSSLQKGEKGKERRKEENLIIKEKSQNALEEKKKKKRKRSSCLC